MPRVLKKRVKRNITKILFIIIICIIIIICLTIFKSNSNSLIHYKVNNNTYLIEKNIIKNDFNFKDLSNYTTNSLESNIDDVEVLTSGMNVKDFYNVFYEYSTYIKNKDSYKKIVYDFEKHYKYEELEELFIKLSSSSIVNLEIIGKSYDDRNLYSIEIGNGSNIIMFEGNIHAAEIAPALYLTKFAIELVNKYGENYEHIRELLHNNKIIIIPSVNPDGYDYSLFGKEIIKNKKSYVYINDESIEKLYYKANANGVDLNRNFPSQLGGLKFKEYELSETFSKTKSTDMYEYFPGDKLGSESETKAMMYIIYKYLSNIKSFISLHSAGQIIYDEQYLLSDRFNEEASNCSKIISDYTGYTQIGIDYDDGHANDGNSTDFIEELAHGYKFSTKTGKLSTASYNEKTNTMIYPMCVITMETLESYTQDLDIIKNEWLNKKLWNAFINIIDR